MKIRELQPQFIKNLPEKLSEGVIYISEEFATAGHLCCCGCGSEIFTPFNKAQWQLTKNQKTGTVSLYPSIGNWKYPCQSHYWIDKNIVKDAGPLPDKIIKKIIKRDTDDKSKYISESNSQQNGQKDSLNYLTRFIRWLFKN